MRDLGIDSVRNTFPESSCDEKCLRAQMDAYYENLCGKTKMPAAAGVSGGVKDADNTND
jgi:hypothetical protein